MDQVETEVPGVDHEKADRFEEAQPQDIEFGHLQEGLDLPLVGQVMAKVLEGSEESLKIQAPGALLLQSADAGLEELGIDGIVVHRSPRGRAPVCAMNGWPSYVACCAHVVECPRAALSGTLRKAS